MEKILSPGPLTAKHAKLENDCAKCHSSFDKSKQNSLCLSCHKEVANDIDKHQGLHGSGIASQGKKCSSCHTEHKGRDFDIRQLDKASFNHNRLTDFPLVASHANPKVTCESCHGSYKDYYLTPRDCFSCHKEKDSHDGRLGQDCSICHKPTVWKDASFDHNKTYFKLQGRHQKLSCLECHKDNSGRMKIDTSCYSCHQKDDVHQGLQKARCEFCHNQNEWKKATKFDHGLTSFPLIGQHQGKSCKLCHASLNFSNADTACISCHRSKDYHKGSLGEDCEKCHNPNGWKKWEFDHNTQTVFKLEGSHTGLECGACHKKPMMKGGRPSSSCYSCHDNDDVHGGRFGETCENCHTVESFRKVAMYRR